MAENKIEVKISPVMDKEAFQNIKTQIENLSKSNTDAKSNNKLQNLTSKAEKAYTAGDFKTYNKTVMELYKNLAELIKGLDSGSTDLGKKLISLSNVFIQKSKELEKAIGSLSKKKASFEKDPEVAAYKKYSTEPFTGKGRQGTVKSQGGLYQTLLTNSKTTPDAIGKFAEKNGLKVDLKGLNIEEQATLVVEAYTKAITKKLQKEITADEKAVDKLNKALEENISLQNKTAEELKKNNPKDATAITAYQSTLPGAASFSTGKAAEAEDKGKIEGTTEAINDQKEAQKQLELQNNKTTTSFKQTILGATAYGLAIRQLKRWISQAVKTITEIDQALTTQAMVSGKTRKETYDLLSAYQDLAKQCGATTTEVAKVATAYFRQGKSVEEAMTLTKTAVTAAKVAGISTTESVDYLTTAVNGFQLAAKDAMQVSDRFAALAASAAVSYDELAVALSKVASQANLAGMSMDYTLALLTKGIETTRESAESIGTALKTVLARMREISDYGATLEDGININNVEMQLSYVNIALRNSSGELRSTEEVLDELGKKWDTLTSNQQASIAKALAGTRQQSRLIAMMSNYQRTTELAVISQQSLGATEAQAAEYLQGMEAAVNKVTTAYQSLVSSITDSEIIISIVNTASQLLNNIADFLSQDGVIGAAITFLAVSGVGILGNLILQKIQATEIARQKEIEAFNEELKAKNIDKAALAKKREALQEAIYTKQKEIAAAKDAAAERKKNILKLETLKTTLLQKKAAGTLTVEEANQLKTIDARIAKQTKLQAQDEIKVGKLEKELTALEAQDKEYEALIKKNDMLNNSSSYLLSSIGKAGKSLISTFLPIVGLIGNIISLTRKEGVEIDKNAQKTEKRTIKEKILAAWKMAQSASTIAVVGWVIAGAILAALIGVTIAAAAGAFKSDTQKEEEKAQKARENIQAMTQDLYNLNKSAQTIDTIANKFENLSKKIIKSTEDLEELESLYQQLKEEGFTDQQIADIKSASPEYAKQIIESIAEQKRSAAAVVAQNKISAAKLWMDTAGTENKAEATAAYNDAILQGWKQDVQRQATQLSTENQQLVNNFLANVNSDSLTVDVGTDLVNSLGSTDLWGKKINATNGSNSWKSKLSKYGSFKNAEDSVYNNIKKAVKNQDFALLSQTLSDQQLTDLMTEMGIEDASVFGNKTKNFVAGLNDDLLSQMKTIGDTSSSDWSSYINNWNSFKDYAAKNGIALEKMYPQIAATIQMISDSPELMNSGWTVQQFSDLTELGANKEDLAALAAWAESSYDPEQIPQRLKNNSELLSKIGNVIFKTATSTQADINNYKKNRGAVIEQIEKFLSGEATTSELRTALEDAGVNSAEALEAAMQGDYKKVYEAIEAANAERDAELKQILKDKEKYYQALLETETDPNKVNEYKKSIFEIQQQIKEIDNLNETSLKAIYKATKEAVKREKELQQKRIDLIREEENKKLEIEKEHLEKLKQAYQDYFSDLDQQTEDENYEDQREQILTNIGALGASTDAASLQALAELEQQLTELEKERQETLRQRGRDALIENIDNQIESIDKSMEELNESNWAILQKLSGRSDVNIAASIVRNRAAAGEDTAVDIMSNIAEVADMFGLDYVEVINYLSKTSGLSNVPNITQMDTKTDTNNNNNVLTFNFYDSNGNEIKSFAENYDVTQFLEAIAGKTGTALTNK